MSINYNQQKRINTSKRNKLFILDYKNKDSQYELKMTGSTLNVYNIDINKCYKNIKCSCPDFKSWARYSNCVCKHCCFLLIKVLKFNESDLLNFFNNLTFSDEEFSKLVEKLDKLELNSVIMNAEEDDIDDLEAAPKNPHFIDKYLIDKFNKLKCIDNKSQFISKESVVKDCPICYDSLENNLLKCPSCKQILHKTCMEVWLNSGNSSCPYCRSKIWENYKDSDINYLNLL
jgi:hypothetical protein